MPDTPQRIATDTSQKLAIRFGETVKAYQKSEQLNIKDLKMIPLVFAGWIRYLAGIDDNGDTFTLSPDPMLDTLQPLIKELKLGEESAVHRILTPLLSDEKIFGINVYDAGMGELVESYVKEMTAGPGAVRNLLNKVTGV